MRRCLELKPKYKGFRTFSNDHCLLLITLYRPSHTKSHQDDLPRCPKLVSRHYKTGLHPNGAAPPGYRVGFGRLQILMKASKGANRCRVVGRIPQCNPHLEESPKSHRSLCSRSSREAPPFFRPYSHSVYHCLSSRSPIRSLSRWTWGADPVPETIPSSMRMTHSPSQNRQRLASYPTQLSLLNGQLSLDMGPRILICPEKVLDSSKSLFTSSTSRMWGVEHLTFPGLRRQLSPLVDQGHQVSRVSGVNPLMMAPLPLHRL